ncbi:heavy metal translocating P-type ATPase [Paraliomyxa miuraensis]|uniref:heavy metal translocating P-type ATPase n=1 Tax=Paraliomyxa miuraensis TaxID=376150 RepID=UPI00225509A3|nr:heavy metal translocating P-type ATPase [Paraliomyxa miuraensis]MCX4246646.1 heavy metal translocating P-type ATPase [Paraliomyxa miuraensis]
MFLQLCLFAASVYYGRRILDNRRESKVPTPSNDEPGERTQALAIPSAAHVRKADSAKAEIDQQFDLSLVCLGINAAARFMAPQVRVLGGVLVLFAGIPILRKAKQYLFEERRASAELLDTIGLTTTVATGHYMSSSIVFFLYAGGQKLRQMSERVAAQSMSHMFGQRTDMVWVLRDGVEQSIPLACLQVGDIVVVDAGVPIPADGLVVGGVGYVDQHILTGESQPLERSAGDPVFAATLVCSGRLHIRVRTTGEATVAAEIAGMMARTAAYTSTLEAEGQRIADRLALPMLTLGGLAYPLVGPAGSVALLNASFLDNMRLFIPLSMLNYLRQASERGILIRDGRSFQVLPQVDTVVFDKTGTLTLNELHVSRVVPTEGVDGDHLLCMAAAAEHRQSHPIARAIVDAARRRKLQIPTVDGTTLELGLGLTARLGRQDIRIGSRRYMIAHEIDVGGILALEDEDDHFTMSSRVYVAVGSTLLGMLELEPTMHPAVEHIIGALRERNIEIYLVSGDQEAPTRALARSLGIEQHFAGVLPADKAELIDELQAGGRTVCFVGDGINDCLALTRAAVSVTMESASASAIHSAQVVIDDLAQLPRLFETADEFRQNVDRIKLSLGIPSLVGIGGVLFAGVGVPVMTALYSASMVTGLSIAMWPHRHRGGLPRAPAPRRPEDVDVLDITHLVSS